MEYEPDGHAEVLHVGCKGQFNTRLPPSGDSRESVSCESGLLRL